MTTEIKPIEWSEEFPSCEEVRYNHVIGSTPLGRFLITWKGWKEDGDKGFSIDEAPWDNFSSPTDYLVGGYDLEETKKVCEDAFIAKITACLIDS
jgi:hypothetical protein